MARKPSLTVVVTPGVAKELDKIWRYNAEHRSERQADAWERFLRSKIRALSTAWIRGRPVEGFPDLLQIVAHKRPGADGHILVFQVDLEAKIVTILHVFHTKQD